MMIFIGGTPLGAPLVGWIGEVAGARWTLWLGGLATAVGVLAASALYLRTRPPVPREAAPADPPLTVAA
jgi:predicted MFS family arabinose efflux permease